MKKISILFLFLVSVAFNLFGQQTKSYIYEKSTHIRKLVSEDGHEIKMNIVEEEINPIEVKDNNNHLLLSQEKGLNRYILDYQTKDTLGTVNGRLQSVTLNGKTYDIKIGNLDFTYMIEGKEVAKLTYSKTKKKKMITVESVENIDPALICVASAQVITAVGNSYKIWLVTGLSIVAGLLSLVAI